MSLAGRFTSLRASMQSILTPIIKYTRNHATPLAQRCIAQSKGMGRRWGAPVAIAGGVLASGVDPDTRQQIYLNAVSRIDPLLDWRFDQTHGRRKRTLLSHYGVTRGGEVLELLPGSSGAFASLDALGHPDTSARSFPLMWRGIDIHNAHWKAGRLQHSAGERAGVPESQMIFQAASPQKNVLQLLKEIPDASMQHVLALHGLSPLFSSSLSYARSSSDVSVELSAILKEVYRVLRPGGHFIFLDEGAYPTGTIARAEQDACTALATHLHPAGRLEPIEISQTLPQSGFDHAHIEQWPSWVDSRSSRKGIRVLNVLEVDGAVVLDGMRGSHPLIAGVATKSIHAEAARPAPITLLKPEQGNMGTMFVR